MWLMLNNAFLSIVANRNDSDTLMVRARIAGDIPAVFPSAEVSNTPKADYPYRAVVSRLEVQAAMVRVVDAIDYDNFKDSVSDDRRHDAYLEVWGVMRDHQQRLAVEPRGGYGWPVVARPKRR